MMRFVLILMVVMPSLLSAYSFDGGRPVGMNGAVLLSNPSVSDLHVCPVSLIEDKQLFGESGFCRKFELRDLDQVYGGAAYRQGRYTGNIAFSQLGRSGYYTEKLLKGGVSAIIDPFMIGVTLSGTMLEFGDHDDSYNAIAVGLAAGYNFKRYHLALVVDNINEPKIASSSPADKRTYNVYAEIEGPSVYSFCGRLTLEENNKPRAAVAQYIRLLDKNALFWSISNNPQMYGGGVEIAYLGFKLTYSASYHPTLGLTHAISLGAGK
jgi:hypothetical protein